MRVSVSVTLHGADADVTLRALTAQLAANMHDIHCAPTPMGLELFGDYHRLMPLLSERLLPFLAQTSHGMSAASVTLAGQAACPYPAPLQPLPTT